MLKAGIVFAMQEELIALKKYLNLEQEHNILGLKFYEGTINNIKCYLVESGVGKVNAARTTQVLIDHFEIDYVFNIGVAGGIANSLKVGDIVVGESLVQHDFDITAFDHDKGYIPNIGVYLKADNYLLDLVKKLNSKYNIVFGTIASGDIFCTESWMAEKINKKFKALCVEMEGAAVSQVCYLNKIPFLVLRSISDTPNNNNVITYNEFLETSTKKIAQVMNDLLLDLGHKSTQFTQK